MPEEKSKPELHDSIFEEAYEKLRIRAESSNLITKVVTDMVTEAEIECRLDDSYKEGIEQGIEKGKYEIVKAMLKKGLAMSDIVSVSGLSEDEIKSLK